MNLKGVVHKYGANVDTDAIVPARYLNVSEPAELAAHCMEGIDSEFLSRVKPGDIIVATTNFGCGSSREHAPIAINIGLPPLECADTDEIKPGDELEVALEKGEIRDITKDKVFKAEPYPDFMLELISAGGLIEYTKKKIKRRSK